MDVATLPPKNYQVFCCVLALHGKTRWNNNSIISGRADLLETRYNYKVGNLVD
jgi:hypothetical protein